MPSRVVWRNGDAGQLGALERHHLPAELAGVARVAGHIAPAAGDAILRAQRVVDRPPHGRLQPLVARHGIGLAQRTGGHGVAIHPFVAIGRGAQAAVGLLHAQQKLESAPHRRLMRAVQVRVPAGQKRQQRQARDAGVGLSAGGMPLLAIGGAAGSAAQRASVPAAAGALIGGQPGQAARRPRFRFPAWPASRLCPDDCRPAAAITPGSGLAAPGGAWLLRRPPPDAAPSPLAPCGRCRISRRLGDFVRRVWRAPRLARPAVARAGAPARDCRHLWTAAARSARSSAATAWQSDRWTSISRRAGVVAERQFAIDLRLERRAGASAGACRRGSASAGSRQRRGQRCRVCGRGKQIASARGIGRVRALRPRSSVRPALRRRWFRPGRLECPRRRASRPSP